MQQYIHTAVAAHDLAPGALLAADDLTLARVLSNGRPSVDIASLVGRKIRAATPRGAADLRRTDLGQRTGQGRCGRDSRRARRPGRAHGRCDRADRRRPRRIGHRLQRADEQAALRNRHRSRTASNSCSPEEKKPNDQAGSLIAAAVLALAAPAAADTLYVAGPPAAAPGHPMHLGADHRATQVGDLVHIVFNFNGSANNSDAATTANTYSEHDRRAAPGSSTCRSCACGGGLGAGSTTGLAKTQTVVQTFTSSMTAVVTNVLPSGAMQVAGDQKLTINGVPQALHVTGTIRGEDIDNTDSVLSSQRRQHRREVQRHRHARTQQGHLAKNHRVLVRMIDDDEDVTSPPSSRSRCWRCSSRCRRACRRRACCSKTSPKCRASPPTS